MFHLGINLLLLSLVLAFNLRGNDAVPAPQSGSTNNGNGCVYVITGTSGTITTPNYPNNYPNSASCKWTIKAPPGALIELTFKDFYLEKTHSCKDDYLLLFDGENDQSRKVGRFCSTTKPEKMTSSTNYIYLEFHSDRRVSKRGFSADYNTIFTSRTTPTTSWKSIPKFVKQPSNETIIEGNPVGLFCSVEGTPEPTITWKKDSQNLIKNQRIAVQNSPFQSVLNITRAAMSDRGMYSCVISNGVGPPVQSHSWIIVKKRVLPLIKKISENRTVQVGSEVILQCNATGPPPMNISWTNMGESLVEKKCEALRNCMVELPWKFVKDTVITCKVGNNAGIVTRNVQIKIKGPPLITRAPTNKNVEVGLSVNFSCQAIGIPPVTISWTKDNQTVRDGVMTEEGRSVLSLSAKENATVTCNAKDRDGTTRSKQARLFVHVTETKESPKRVPLTFLEKPEDLSLAYKTTATLKCKAEGYPEPQLSWIQDGADVTQDATLSSRTSFLTLKSLEKTTTVTCIAKNSHEEINSTARIKVKPEPHVAKKKSGGLNMDMKVIIGALGGLLLLTISFIIFLICRMRNKKNITYTMEENRNLVNNPLFNSEEKNEAEKGVETLHFPSEDIIHCEDISDDVNVHMFLGLAKDLPFTKRGEHKVVVKVLKDANPSEDKKEDFAIEAALLVNLVHPNVARLMAISIKTTPLCLLFEYSEYGYLDKYLRDCDINGESGSKAHPTLSNVDRLSIAKQIAAGMQYLAEKGYIHQELRARSCMVFNNQQVKVANLGLRWATAVQNFFKMEPAEKQKFPVRWLSPEVILYGSYSESADVWSYGVLVWEIFSNGQLPYTGIDDNDVVAYVRGRNVLPRPKACPHDVYEFLKSCWEITPLERPKFSSLCKTMSSFYDSVQA